MNTTFLSIRTAIIVLCGGILFFACKKEHTEQSNTEATAEFFTSTTTNQEVQNFITNIQAINDQHEFVTKLASEYGLPKWDYTDTFTSPEGVTVIAPLVRPDAQEVAAVLIGVYNRGKLHLNVMPKEDVADLSFSNGQKAGKNEYGALFYKFNRLLFSYGPKAKDKVVKNGKKILFSESKDDIKISGLRDSYICTAWYQWQYDSWVYLDTTCEVAYGWQSDGTYNLPYVPGVSIPQNPPSGGSGSTGGSSSPEYSSQASNSDINEYNEAEGSDPDLSSDCSSWAFAPVGPDNNYQAVGVKGIDIDIIHSYIVNGDWAVSYESIKRNEPLYYEFPHKRADGTIISPGEAARISATITDIGEKTLEDMVGSGAPLGATVTFNKYIEILNTLIKPYGGRVTKNNNYANTPVTTLKKGFTGGTCN